MDPTLDSERTSPRSWAVELAACVAIGAGLGLIGPFGSYLNGGLPSRVAYWTGTFVLGAVALITALRVAAPVARRFGVPIWVWLPLLVLVVNLPLCVASRLAAVALWPGLGEHVGWVEWYGQSALIGLVSTSLYTRFRLYPPAALDPRASPAASAADFLDRLPPGLARDVVCLQMEDHYVRVHAADRSVLVLMPLRQAMTELVAVEGMQVHRSWWVARRAVAGVIRDGRNTRIKLSNGLEPPVARAQVARLRAAGWID